MLDRSSSPLPLLHLLREARLGEAEIYGDPTVALSGLTVHAQSVKPGYGFIAIRGTSTDSHHLAPEAAARGARVVFADSEIASIPGVTIVRLANTRKALGPLAYAFVGNPERDMRIAGVTGTNGKSSTTFQLQAILESQGVPAARIGTLGAGWAGTEIACSNTTPGPLELAALFATIHAGGVRHVAMEVSSHGIHQNRIAAIPFTAGVLTNVTQDHLDYHGSYEAYVETKKSYFTEFLSGIPRAVSVLNVDDPVGEELARDFQGTYLTMGRGSERGSDIQADEIVCGPTFTEFILRIRGKVGRVRSPLVGGFNVTNMLAAASMAHCMGLDVQSIARGLCAGVSVPGRFERIDAGQPFTVIVDYAHTPDALARVLRTARRLSQNRLICVYGCGGNRDQGKRPLMGRAAGLHADHVIVTSDNPRNEDPEEIARQTAEGLVQARVKSGRYQIQIDRRVAIERALTMATPGDVVLVAGKGHETYQEIRGEKHPFDDRKVVREILGTIAGNFQAQPVQADAAGVN